MKLQFLLASILAIVAAAWTAQDREIFALRDAVAKDQGADMTFYKWLGVDNSANDNQIARAYRKLSTKIHPDKNPGKKATERFARLGLVTKILRSQGRDRYDFFLKYGFPAWKGTDYYYSRYRPGLVTVVVFLYTLVSGAQFLFLKLTARQHKNHMSAIINEAKNEAWGTGVGANQRKVTLDSGLQFMVYPTGEVALIDENGEHPLRLDEVEEPTWKNTVLYTLPMKVYCKFTGQQPPVQITQEQPAADALAEQENEKAPKKKVKAKPVSKAGGSRRRK